MKTLAATILAMSVVGCAAVPGVFGQAGSIRATYYAPAWGPNTNGEEVVYFLKQVTFESDTDEQTRIYFCSIKPDGSQRQEIASLWKDQADQSFENFANAVTMDVNAATKHAAIGVAWGDRGGIFVLGLDGKGLLRVWPKEWETNRPTGASYPTWSPDGQWIAFEEKRTSKGGGYDYRHIVKCHPDGTGYTPLTQPDGYKINVQPAWAPTTNLVAYVHFPDHYPGDCYLWLMDGDGNNKRNTKVWGDYPRWSPDGRFILHSSLNVVDANTGKVVKVLKPHPPLFPKWGKSGYVFVGPSHIGLTDLEVKTTKPLLKNVSGRGRSSDLDKEEFRW